MNCMMPIPAREPTVLKIVKSGRCFGSFVSTAWAALVTEVWKV